MSLVCRRPRFTSYYNYIFTSPAIVWRRPHNCWLFEIRNKRFCDRPDTCTSAYLFTSVLRRVAAPCITHHASRKPPSFKSIGLQILLGGAFSDLMGITRLSDQICSETCPTIHYKTVPPLLLSISLMIVASKHTVSRTARGNQLDGTPF